LSPLQVLKLSKENYFGNKEGRQSSGVSNEKKLDEDNFSGDNGPMKENLINEDETRLEKKQNSLNTFSQATKHHNK